MSVMAGAEAEEVAELIVAAAEPGGRSRALEALHRAVSRLDNRSRHRRTHGRETPARCPILTVPWPSAAARTILARQTCFCGLLRSATTALSRARSVLLTSRLIPLAMPHHIAAGQPTEHYDCVNPLDSRWAPPALHCPP